MWRGLPARAWFSHKKTGAGWQPTPRFVVVFKKCPDISGQTQTTAFQCTKVVGFSQTNQWFTAGFENFVENNRRQLLWRSSSNIDLWADPNFAGWSEPLVSPCAQASTNPDRVVLTISGNRNSDPNWWADQIRAVIGVIRAKYPAVRQIVLQPVVGGPNHSVCMFEGQAIRASENHPVIDQGIAKVLGGDVFAGISPEVRTCADYRDQLGHLQAAGNQVAGETIGRYYASLNSAITDGEQAANTVKLQFR